MEELSAIRNPFLYFGLRAGKCVVMKKAGKGLTETERLIASGDGSLDVSTTGLEGTARERGVGAVGRACELGVGRISSLGKMTGEARGSKSLFSITRFLVTWPPRRTRETTSREREEGTSSRGLLRFFARDGCRMMTRHKRRSRRPRFPPLLRQHLPLKDTPLSGLSQRDLCGTRVEQGL